MGLEGLENEGYNLRALDEFARELRELGDRHVLTHGTRLQTPTGALLMLTVRTQPRIPTEDLAEGFHLERALTSCWGARGTRE